MQSRRRACNGWDCLVKYVPALANNGLQLPLVPSLATAGFATSIVTPTHFIATASQTGLPGHSSYTKGSPFATLRPSSDSAVHISNAWDEVQQGRNKYSLTSLESLANVPIPTIDATFPLPSPTFVRAADAGPQTSGSTSKRDSMGLCSLRNAVIFALISTVTFGGLLAHYATKPMTAEALEDGDWIATSKSMLDRCMCRWFGLCGIAHAWKKGKWYNIPREKLDPPKKYGNSSGFWDSGPEASTWSEEERLLREIPQYVVDHAPYVHLFSKEDFWPSDLGDHLIHTTPHLNYTPIDNKYRHPNLTNLDKLNEFGRHVFLKSDDNVEKRPEWLGSKFNIPQPEHKKISPSSHFPGRQGQWTWHPAPGIREDPDLDKWWYVNTTVNDKIWEESATGIADQQLQALNKPGSSKWELRKRAAEQGPTREGYPSAGGRSDAPAILIVVDKGHGVVDAFWFYFYSYNLGNKVFNIRFGNHVGDWEHTCIRFYNGKPKAIFLSEHDMGAAYAWEAVEKIGERPVTYSATGTHAMYATPGVHTYVLPFGLLHDITDRGPLWDPALNMASYTYDYKKDHLRSSTLNPRVPTEWFYFWGHWGDKFYPLDDPRQYRFAGQYHYVNGPLGPRFKRLARKRICQGRDNEPCHIQYWVQERLYFSTGALEGKGDDHDMTDGESKRFLGDQELKT